MGQPNQDLIHRASQLFQLIGHIYTITYGHRLYARLQAYSTEPGELQLLQRAFGGKIWPRKTGDLWTIGNLKEIEQATKLLLPCLQGLQLEQAKQLLVWAGRETTKERHQELLILRLLTKRHYENSSEQPLGIS